MKKGIQSFSIILVVIITIFPHIRIANATENDLVQSVYTQSVSLTQIKSIHKGDRGDIFDYIKKTNYPKNSIEDRECYFTSSNWQVINIGKYGEFTADYSDYVTLTYDKGGPLQTSISIHVLDKDTNYSLYNDFKYKIENTDGYQEIILTGYVGDDTNLVIPDSIQNIPITKIGVSAFEKNTNLKSITIPNGIKSIEDRAFYSCTNIENIYIPYTVKNIGAMSFFYCTNLHHINIPGSVSRIGSQAFGRCESLESITIPDGITNIRGMTFWECYNLTQVNIPDTVKSIDAGAFRSCTGLKKLYLPNTIETIGNDAFEACYSLSEFTIPNNVCSIGSGAFASCISLSEITIPDSVTVIESGTFKSCGNLKKVVIPETVQSIGNAAFELCSSLTEITLPVNLESIAPRLFWGCKKLSHMAIPKKVKQIGSSSFSYCPSLQSFEIPDGVELIESNTFYYCSNLENITIPNSVVAINAGAFQYCNSLNDVYYNGLYSEWEKINIANNNENLTSANIHCSDIPETSGSLYCKSAMVQGITIPINDQWFFQDSIIYNHNIARMCSLVDLAGYQDESDLKSTLESLSFIVDNNYLNLHTGREDNGRDKVNYFIASKDIILSDGTNKLIFVGCIGTDDAQWNSDFDPDGKGSNTNYSDSQSLHRINHRGFNDAKNFVFEKLAEYFKRNAFDRDRTKLLITGHSRGAATANLISAELINGRKIDGQHTVKSENLFTYTYATPNNTTDQNRYDPKYDRIINIVNPTDFITKTMPSAWGWGRYGKTYTLPSKTNDNNYNNLKASMLDYYTILNYATSGKTKFHDYPLGEFEVFSVVTTMTNSIWGLDSFYNIPHSLYGLMPMTPYSFFQNGLCPIVGGEGNKALAYTIVGSSLSPGKNNKLYRSITEYFLADQLISANFEDAHKMVTYCAYMMGLSSSELLSYRKGYLGSVNCPVDVEIYDMMTNELVGQITNNTVNEEIAAKANSVVMTVDGDEKQFWLPSNGYYDVKLIGNDTGTMDYSVKTINSDLGEISRSNYDNIPLEPNKTYAHNYDSYSIGSDYDGLRDEDWNTVSANESFSADEKQTYSVTIDVEGSGVATDSITVTSGDYVNVVAEPIGSAFLGWYNGDELLSQDMQYRFRPYNSIALKARFTAMFGDVDLDDTICINDVTMLQRYLCDLESLTKTQLDVADTNGDGKIDIADATYLQMYLAEYGDIVLGKRSE